MATFVIYGPGSPISNVFGYYKGGAGPEEWGVSTGVHLCVNGGCAHTPVIRFTKGDFGRNRSAAERYAALRNAGVEHAKAREITLSEHPPVEQVV